MKKGFGLVIIALTLILSSMFVFLPDLFGQEGKDKDTEGGEKASRERPKDSMRKEFRKGPKLDELAEGRKWLDDVKKYREEITALENELGPVREEVRNLFRQHQNATTEEGKKELETKIELARSKEDELDLAIAKKKKEFAEKNYKLALERMIEAEVELRDTERKIWIKQEFMGKHFPEGRGRWKRGPGPEEESKDPPPEEKNREDNPPPFRPW